jgi:flagellar motor switch/type III secretory pathway protein FliN
MEPVLTQEELEAIYAAMKGDDLPSVSVDDVALTAGQEFISRAEQKWNEAIKGISQPIENILMGALGQRITVRLYPSEAWVDDDAEPSESDVVPLKDASSVLATGKIGEMLVIVSIDLELARKVVERRTGAVSLEEENESGSQLTPLEFRLLKDLIRDLIKAAAKASPIKVAGEISAIDPEDVWMGRDPKETWIIGSLGIAEMSGRGIRFMAPSGLFMPKAVNSRNLLSSHLKRAKITLSAELGKFRLNVAKLWHMKPGTVIPMSTTIGDPLHISIGGVAKLLGEPLVSRGNVAVRLVGRIENGVD